MNVAGQGRLKMTTINVQLELTGVSLASPSTVGRATIAPPRNIGFLSSITPDPILLTAFLVGTGLSSVISGTTSDPPVNLSYNKLNIQKRRGNQKNAFCAVIAAVGGAITSAAVAGDSDTTTTYVSLVGDPSGIGDQNIKGGVSLDSYKLNKKRKEYLSKLSGGGVYGDPNIVLYTNQSSQMHADEIGAWGTGMPVVQSAAGIANNPAQFQTDFTTGPLGAGGLLSGAKALIISDDPFFRASRADLIKQVNMWLAGDPTVRKVVYPSQIYGSPVLKDSSATPQPQQPTSGQSILYGPDLIAAYHLLGTLARVCFEDPTASPGFVSAVPFIVEL